MYWDIWGRSMSNSSRWRVWILIRFTRWTVFMRSPSSEHLNPFKQIDCTIRVFSTLLPRCLYPPTLVQVVFIDLPTPPVSPCGPSHPMPQLSTSLVSLGWFWNCLTFPGLGNRCLFRIRFCWGLWGHIHLQELVYEIRLSSEKKPWRNIGVKPKTQNIENRWYDFLVMLDD